MKYKIGILILAFVLISRGSAPAQVPVYEVDLPAYGVHIGQTPVLYAIDFSDLFSAHGHFDHFDGFILENFVDPDKWIVFAKLRDPQFPETTFISTDVIPISPNHLKVKGILKRLMVGRESEQAIIVNLELRPAKGKTLGRAEIEFTATANIDIGGNETIHVVVEGIGTVLDR